MLIFLLLIFSLVVSYGRRSASRPVKSFTVRRQEIYYCRKPEQIKLHLPVDIQEYKETKLKLFWSFPSHVEFYVVIRKLYIYMSNIQLKGDNFLCTTIK